MKRQTLSVIGVAVLVLFAGAAALTGATVANGQQHVVDIPADASVQQDSENATNQVDVTVETLELQNVTVTDAVVNHVHVTGNVTAGDEPVLETEDDPKTVENITAHQLRVTNATLKNVSFSNLTIQNESLATALLGNQTPEGEDLNVSSATLENQTIDGLVIEHGNLGDADIEGIQFQSADAMDTESDELTQGDAAMEIYSLSVDNATIGDASSVGLSIGNQTIPNETNEEGDGS